jgi:hypothetical protein
LVSEKWTESGKMPASTGKDARAPHGDSDAVGEVRLEA